MLPLGLAANALARRLLIPPNRITAILDEKRAVTADTALRLARFFGTTLQLWLNLQTSYDLKIAEEAGRSRHRDRGTAPRKRRMICVAERRSGWVV